MVASGNSPGKLCAAVVIVAVKVVLAAKTPPFGVKVAMKLVES